MRIIPHLWKLQFGKPEVVIRESEHVTILLLAYRKERSILFQKVLIANRGAIAVRIARTLRRMGIQSVAVYTTADESSLHVDFADEAVWIGEGAVQESYVDMEKIIAAARQTGADAIHPGYGFLSENACFARACEQAGIRFIGPDPEQIERFGYKHVARNIALQAGVPLLPGTDLIASAEEAVDAAQAIGFPVMLKSTAGGGGIGMRVCANETELREAFSAVQRLSAQHFRYEGVFMEKYIPQARHIEVQLFGNRSGEIVTIGERDCTLQRRNQKVLEECPAACLRPEVREALHQAAKNLASMVGYRSAGTVEFLYDPESESFYFLEVNTRLQVEHGVTEEVYGIDLVEWMVREACDELFGLAEQISAPSGHSIQVRLYAEDPGDGFRPSAGRIDHVVWPEATRIETWVEAGTIVSSFYDPLLAKLIVHSENREMACDRLIAAVKHTRIYGISHNLRYLESLVTSQSFQSNHVYTKWLAEFQPPESTLFVIDGGLHTTLQDWPGRLGHWDVGVPPSGPMDELSFRIGNLLLGNDEGACGLEFTMRGGVYQFRDDTWFCLTGADMSAELNGQLVERYRPLLARAGQVLRLSDARTGMRAYLLVGGGFDVPKTLGSGSTFALGGFGGHGGRALLSGDVLAINRVNGLGMDNISDAFTKAPEFTHDWVIGVIPGPHATSEFLPASYLEQLTHTSWQVHFNSSRTGVRLLGPAPKWVRDDGGEAGLHPSNIHDNPYAIGALNLTGDLPILLGQDGPSLGGFVCPVTTAACERWKIGQLRPGDTVRFKIIGLEQARALDVKQRALLNDRQTMHASYIMPLPEMPFANYEEAATSSILKHEHIDHAFPITVRTAGDEYILVEIGALELDLRYRFQVHLLMDAIRSSGRIPYIDLTPGVRSLQIHLDRSQMTVEEACRIVLEIDRQLPDLSTVRVPSRIVRMPLSFDDPSVQQAVDRYQQNVREDAPWCPSNIEFIRRINGLESIKNVWDIVFSAKYLVLGLGDVYLGAPVATPIDPRHRLVTTKYNPARTWTPENAVGIGGSYMCIYGMESPGGYQLFGRTVQIWNTFRTTRSFAPGKPWLLRFFDQVEFYPVSAQELANMRKEFLRGKFELEIVETTFDLGAYLAFLDEIHEDATVFKQRQQVAFNAERERWRQLGLAEYVSESHVEVTDGLGEDDGVTVVRSNLPGSVWKVHVRPGQQVQPGDTLVVIESMKMEFPITATCQGIIKTVHVRPGQELPAGGAIVGVEEVPA